MSRQPANNGANNGLNILLDFRRENAFREQSLIDALEIMLRDANAGRLMVAQEDAAYSQHLQIADVLIGKPSETDLMSAPELKWIHVPQAGVDGLPFDRLRRRKMIVTCSRGAMSAAVAEHVMGLILVDARRLDVAVKHKLMKRWRRREWRTVRGLEGSTIGLVGYGEIGREVAKRAHAFGMKVLAFRRSGASGDSLPRNVPPGDSPPGDPPAIWPETLEELLSKSDYVVLAVPLTPETQRMIGSSELSAMKCDGYLINVSRGKVVDETALIDALCRGTIRGAALDVFETEPLPETSPLWDLDNVLLTPHVAGVSHDYWKRVLEIFRRNLFAFMNGDPLENLVDFERAY